MSYMIRFTTAGIVTATTGEPCIFRNCELDLDAGNGKDFDNAILLIAPPYGASVRKIGRSYVQR